MNLRVSGRFAYGDLERELMVAAPTVCCVAGESGEMAVVIVRAGVRLQVDLVLAALLVMADGDVRAGRGAREVVIRLRLEVGSLQIRIWEKPLGCVEVEELVGLTDDEVSVIVDRWADEVTVEEMLAVEAVVVAIEELRARRGELPG